MTYLNQHHDSISTVQLSPFGEEQWNRIVTYSPIYVHWTDMLMMTTHRAHKPTYGKLNSIDQIDINTLKLEDEILLNELHHMRRAATLPSKEKNSNHESKVFDDERDHQTASSSGDYQGSSDFFQESKEPTKHHSSYVEPSFTHQQYNTKRSVPANQTILPQANSINQVTKLPQMSLGPKPQPSLGVQLRQSAIAREHAVSATNDRRTSTPLSISSSKRTINSAHSSHRHQQQQQQYRTLQSSLSNEINTSSNIHEQLTGESASSSARRTRARSTNSSRSTIHMLKTKNNRTRQKQNIELKTLLVEPWKQAYYSDGILDETIPNSLEIMHRMCGPATAFERNLRYNYHRQLKQFRNGSTYS